MNWRVVFGNAVWTVLFATKKDYDPLPNKPFIPQFVYFPIREFC